MKRHRKIDRKIDRKMDRLNCRYWRNSCVDLFAPKVEFVITKTKKKYFAQSGSIDVHRVRRKGVYGVNLDPCVNII